VCLDVTSVVRYVGEISNGGSNWSAVPTLQATDNTHSNRYQIALRTDHDYTPGEESFNVGEKLVEVSGSRKVAQN
jgi:hypothetical protein